MSKFVTVTGRLISGSTHERQEKDFNGVEYPEDKRPLVMKLAIPKTDPGAKAMVDAVKAYAKSMFTGSKEHLLNSPKFAWRIIDGDTDVNNEGQPWSAKEGFAGHMVFSFKTQFGIDCIRETGAPVAASDIKRGDFIRIAGTFGHSEGQGIPCVHLNPSAVMFIREGEKIGGGPSANELFGVPSPAAQAFDVVASATEPKLTEKARAMGMTYGDFKAQQWTDEQLKAQGLIE